MIYRFSCFVLAATFILIIAGGLVTSQDYGLAVPDWPKSFGVWMPEMKGGVLFEHGHRMIAGFVGTLTLILTVLVWWKEKRKALRVLASLALVAVILQAVLGGLTVLFKLPTAISTMHATLGQTFFCLILAIVQVSSRWWKEWKPVPSAEPSSLPRLFLITTCFIYLQLILGSWMRHSNAALAIPDFPLSFGRVIPVFSTPEIALHFAHRVNALIVFVLVSWCATRVMHNSNEIPLLRRASLGLMMLVLIQIGLGALTIWTRTAVPVATAHVAVGALILATSLMLTMRSFRIFGSPAVKVRSAGYPEAAAV